MSNQVALPRNMSGLDALHLAAQQYGLEKLWNDFESRFSDLFVHDAAESRVGKAIDGNDQIQWATTREELMGALEKGACELLLASSVPQGRYTF